MKTRNIHYTDGTPSREYEDWETTGHEEVERIYAKCRQKTSITQARDNLNSILDLVILCRECLLNSETIDITEQVADVLHFQVIEQIKSVEQELARL